MKKRVKAALVVLGVLIVARAVLPPLLLTQANRFLGSFSPAYSLRIGDLDFSLWRGAYTFEDVRGTLKSDGSEFFEAKNVDVAVAWRELIRLRLLTDVEIERPRLVLTREGYDAITTTNAKPKEEAKEARRKLFPLRVERITVNDGNLQIAEILNLPEAERWRITGVTGRISNLTSTPVSPVTWISAQGRIMEAADLRVVAKLSTQAKPLVWEAEAELHAFDMVKANPWLKRWIPLTFTSGSASAYAEALSTRGRIEGYVKPFFEDVKVLDREENLVNLRHLAFEVIAAFGNRFLRTPSDKIVATTLDFEYDKEGGFRWKKGVALTAALENAFGRPLKPGLEDRYDLLRSSRSLMTSVRDEESRH